MTRQHGVGAPGQLKIAVKDTSPKLLISALLAKHLELRVKIEDHRGRLEPARRAARPRMKADDEKCLAAEAEGEMGTGGIGVDRRIILVSTPGILVGE